MSSQDIMTKETYMQLANDSFWEKLRKLKSD